MFAFNPYTQEIKIAAPKRLSTFTDKEISEFNCDALIHEHMHKILQDLFNTTTCKLYDAIEHNFRNTKIVEHVFSEGNYQTYYEAIAHEGFKAFLEDYDIDNISFNQACIICNNRLKGEI